MSPGASQMFCNCCFSVYRPGYVSLAGCSLSSERWVDTNAVLLHATPLLPTSIERLRRCCPLVSLSLSQHISKLFQRIPAQLRLRPQIRCQEAVAVANRHEGSFQRVLKSLGTTRR